MTRFTLALRLAVLAVALLWWLPTILAMFGSIGWREVRMRAGLVRVRRLRRAGRLDDVAATLDRLRQDYL